MEVTLKRAAELARAASEAAAAIKLPYQVEVSIHVTGAVNVAEPAKQRLEAAFDDVIGLTRSVYALRSAIGTENAKRGISGALTERKEVDVLIEHYGRWLKQLDVNASEGPDTLQKRLQAAIRRSEDASQSHYGRSDTVTLNLATEEMRENIANLLAEKKRERRDLTDRIAGINLNTLIAVPTDVEATLAKHKLV